MVTPRSIKKLEIIKVHLENNLLSEDDSVIEGQRKCFRIHEELNDLKKYIKTHEVSYLNKKSLFLYRIDVKEANNFIKVVIKQIDDVIDKSILGISFSRKSSIKHFVLGLSFSFMSVIHPFDLNAVEHLYNGPLQTDNLKVNVHLSNSQRNELKELVDLTFSEVCEYGFGPKYNPEVILMVASTVLNRRDYRPKEFGYSIHEVIHKKGAYYGLKNNLHYQAKHLNFSSDINAKSYINIFRLVKKLYIGGLPRKKGFFFFTSREVLKLKRSKFFNFNYLRYEYSIGPYLIYTYKVV